jgi:uncharacterized protein (DUF2225 family)
MSLVYNYTIKYPRLYMSNMTTIFPISLRCPICETEFGSHEIGSCGFASKRTDFRPNYWGLNPVNYFYHLCPECGFCASKPLYESQITHEGVIQAIKQLGVLRESSLPMKLERAMVCLELLRDGEFIHSNNFDLANSWINAFWWAETKEQEHKFGKIVISYLKQAISEDELPDKDVAISKYLIAEINRRIGNTEEAVKYFDEVLSLIKDDTDSKFLYELTQQQKTHPQENMGSNKNKN